MSKLINEKQLIFDIENQNKKQPKYELRSWINHQRLDNICLCVNPNAINYLEENPREINYDYLSQNINGSSLFFKNPEKINRPWISKNPGAIDFLREYPEKIFYRSLCANHNPDAIEMLLDDIENNKHSLDWFDLSKNPYAMPILEDEDYSNNINWLMLSMNPTGVKLLEDNLNKIPNLAWSYISENPGATQLIYDNLDKINWDTASSNPNLMDLLMDNLDKINYYYLSMNTHPLAIDLLMQNPHKVDKVNVSCNPNAYIFLDKYRKKISWEHFCTNPCIFVEKPDFSPTTSSSLVNDVLVV